MNLFLEYGLGLINKVIWAAIIFTILIIILTLVFSWSIRSEMITFTENVRYEGYITEEMYTDFVKNIWLNYVEIDMNVIKNHKEGEPLTILQKENIFEKIKEEGIYRFKVGDEFKLHLRGNIFMIKINHKQGGMILNEKYR